MLRSEWRAFRSVAQARHGYPAKTTSASDTNAGLSRLVAADHSQAHEHGWIELLTVSLGRHAEFARSSRSRTSTTSATNRAGRSGQSLHVCAPLFEDPTVSISHPTESAARNYRRPAPCNAPATSDMGSIAMCVARIAASRADWGARNRLCCPRARITHCCGFPAHRRNTRDAVSRLRCLGRPVVSRHSLTFWCERPPYRGTCTMPCRTSWTLRSTAVGTLRGRSGRVAHARSSQRRRARAVRSAGVSQ